LLKNVVLLSDEEIHRGLMEEKIGTLDIKRPAPIAIAAYSTLSH
jgi:hypothetical protein